jgi:Outer membrane protein beta-barrel domain
MKKVIILALCCTFIQVTTNAQSFKWGIRLGISTPDIKPGDLNPIQNSTNSFKIKVEDANYGYHGGLWARVRFGDFMIQPEAVFNSSSVSYKITNTSILGLKDSFSLSESFKNIDIPFMLGYKVSGIRFMAGPVGHLNLTNGSEITNSDFKAKFTSIKWGYQAGIGLDFGGLGLDLRYEGNFDKFGDYINIGNIQKDFAVNPSRLIVSMAIGF